MVFNQKLKKDAVVMRLACTVHSWMAAYVAVIPHAFAAVTDDSGTFTIARVPPGSTPSRPGTSATARCPRRST